jgi:glycosyltransferase involved in cell wall biosynthesis
MFNAGDGVQITLSSIVEQTTNDFEVIIVDDGSQDNGSEIARSFMPEIKLVRQENLGITHALNTGLQHCEGDFIARIDCYDLAYRDRFEKQVQALIENPDLGAVGGHMMLYESDGTDLGLCRFPTSPEETEQEMLSGNYPLLHTGAMIRKERILEIGGYDPFYNGREDFDLWCRLSLVSQVSNVDSLVVRSLSTARGISYSSVYLFPLMELALKERNERVQRGLTWKNEALRLEYKKKIETLKRFEDSPQGRKRARAIFYGKRAGFLLRSDQRKAALKEYMNSMFSDISYPKAWAGIASALLFPNKIHVMLVRASKRFRRTH